MRKIFGWTLIIVWILFTLLPLYPQTEQVIVEGSPTVIETYSFENGKMVTHEHELPNFSIEERIFKTWFIFTIPLEIFENPAYGIGKLIGYFGVLGVGIWLVRKKKIIGDKVCA